jgi:hypothetical protein
VNPETVNDQKEHDELPTLCDLWNGLRGRTNQTLAASRNICAASTHQPVSGHICPLTLHRRMIGDMTTTGANG